MIWGQIVAIKYVKGDATYPQGEGKKFIVHCVNTLGAWGKGFVLSISKRWQEPEKRYKKWIRMAPNAMLGGIDIVKVEEDIFIVNLLGQDGIYPKNGVPPIRYDAIRKGLHQLYLLVRHEGAVHMPRMGSGLAGGSWPVIEKIINEELVDKGVGVTIYDL